MAASMDAMAGAGSAETSPGRATIGATAGPGATETTAGRTVNAKNMRFLTPETIPDLFRFPADMARLPAEVNQLNNQVLVRYFEAEWRKVIR